MCRLRSLKHTQLSPLQNLSTVPLWKSTLIWRYLPTLPSSQDVTMFSSKIRTRPFELRRTASLRTVVTEAPENSSSCEFHLTHCGLGLETFLAFCFLSDSRRGAQRALGTGCLSSLHQAFKIFPVFRVCSASSAAATSPWRGPRIYDSSALFTSERELQRRKEMAEFIYLTRIYWLSGWGRRIFYLLGRKLQCPSQWLELRWSLQAINTRL